MKKATKRRRRERNTNRKIQKQVTDYRYALRHRERQNKKVKNLQIAFGSNPIAYCQKT